MQKTTNEQRCKILFSQMFSAILICVDIFSILRQKINLRRSWRELLINERFNRGHFSSPRKTFSVVSTVAQAVKRWLWEQGICGSNPGISSNAELLTVLVLMPLVLMRFVFMALVYWWATNLFHFILFHFPKWCFKDHIRWASYNFHFHENDIASLL